MSGLLRSERPRTPRVTGGPSRDDLGLQLERTEPCPADCGGEVPWFRSAAGYAWVGSCAVCEAVRCGEAAAGKLEAAFGGLSASPEAAADIARGLAARAAAPLQVEPAQSAAWAALERVVRGETRAAVLWGLSGGGKTLLALQAVRQLVQLQVRTRFVDEATLFRAVSREHDRDELHRPTSVGRWACELLDGLETPRALVIDDVGVRGELSDAKRDALYALVNGRYARSDGIVILTTNLSLSKRIVARDKNGNEREAVVNELEQLRDARLWRRLREMAGPAGCQPVRRGQLVAVPA